MSCNKLGNFPTDNSPKFHERNLEEKKSNMIFLSPFLSRAHVESCNFVELGELNMYPSFEMKGSS